MAKYVNINYYETLNIPREATQGEIKKAYKKLAQQTHPDLNEGSDDKQFTSIFEAYEVLSDSQKRVEYDQCGLLGVEYNQAVVKLQTALLQLINNTWWPGADLVLQLKNNVVTYKQELEQVKADTIKTIERLTTIRNCLKTRSKFTRNVFHEPLNAAIKQVQTHKTKVIAELEIAEKMLHILEHYEYSIQRLL